MNEALVKELRPEAIDAARAWLEEQSAVVHPGPIETVRDALKVAAALPPLRRLLKIHAAFPVAPPPSQAGRGSR